MREAGLGGKGNLPLDGTPEIVKTEPWDGKDGEIIGANKDNTSSSSSKLLRAEVPLSRHGRGNKLASAIVNPRSNNNEGSSSVLDVPFRGREIVAYDDIL